MPNIVRAILCDTSVFAGLGLGTSVRAPAHTREPTRVHSLLLQNPLGLVSLQSWTERFSQRKRSVSSKSLSFFVSPQIMREGFPFVSVSMEYFR